MNKLNFTRMVEAEGFRDGTQDVRPDAALAEIDKHFAQLQEIHKMSTKDRIKSLEADISYIEQQKLDTDRHWADLEIQTDGMPPPIFLCICAVIFSGLIILGEMVFLAPVMDGFGIADPAWQCLLAAVIVLVCSGLFEINKNRWLQVDTSELSMSELPRQKPISRRTQMALLGFLNLLTLPLVGTLGFWRAEEMIFAAATHPGAWHDFLKNNATLTRFVVVLLTISLPVFVALAFDWGVSGLRFAIEWRRTRAAYKRITAVLAKKLKQLESEEEKAQCRLQELDEKRQEWNQSYLQNHELGQIIGAKQLPLWQIVVKLVAVTLMIVVLCLLTDPILRIYLASAGERYFLYIFLVSGLAGIYSTYLFRMRERPSADQLYRQKAVNWRDRNENGSFYKGDSAGNAFDREYSAGAVPEN